MIVDSSFNMGEISKEHRLPRNETSIYDGWNDINSESNIDDDDSWMNEGAVDVHTRLDLRKTDEPEVSEPAASNIEEDGNSQQENVVVGKDENFSIPTPSSAAESPVVRAAGVAGIVTGAVIAAPVGIVAGIGAATAAGIGAAYVAASQDNAPGEMARAVGEAVSSMGDRALKMEEKHKVVTVTKQRIDTTMKKVVDCEGTKEIMNSTGKATRAAVNATEQAFRSSWKGIVKFNNEQQISFRTTQLAARGAYFLAGKLRSHNGEPVDEERQDFNDKENKSFLSQSS